MFQTYTRGKKYLIQRSETKETQTSRKTVHFLKYKDQDIVVLLQAIYN